MVVESQATRQNTKFFCTLFDQMNKIVESYKKCRDGMTAEMAIDYGILSRTPWEAGKTNDRAKDMGSRWSKLCKL